MILLISCVSLGILLVLWTLSGLAKETRRIASLLEREWDDYQRIVCDNCKHSDSYPIDDGIDLRCSRCGYDIGDKVD